MRNELKQIMNCEKESISIGTHRFSTAVFFIPLCKTKVTVFVEMMISSYFLLKFQCHTEYMPRKFPALELQGRTCQRESGFVGHAAGSEG